MADSVADSVVIYDSRGNGGARTTYPGRRSGEEDRLLAQYAQCPSEDVLEQLVERFQPLARSMAARYKNRSEPLDDLLQVANVGLIKAIKGFDPSHGSRFSSYAVPTILGELRRHFRDRVWSVRLPRSLQERWMEMNAAESDITSRLGHAPSTSEICDELGWTDQELSETVDADRARLVSSLDSPVQDGDGGNPTDGHAVIGTNDQHYERVEAILASRSAELSERERLVLSLQYLDGLSQREIGSRIGVSQMQVSRISRCALHRLLAAVRGESCNFHRSSLSA